MAIALGIALVYVVASAIWPMRSKAELPPALRQFVQNVPSGFRVGGVYTTTDTSQLPEGLPTYGSWIDSDASTGTMTTPWRTVNDRRLIIFVAGYPNHPSLSLHVEFNCGQQRTSTSVTAANPGEHWTPVSVTAPACDVPVQRVRVVAIDSSRQLQGWMGFSEPIAAVAVSGASRREQIARFLGCAVFAFAMVFGPGVALRRFLPVVGTPAFIVLPGFAILFLLGLSTWLLGGGDASRTFCQCGAVGVLFASLVLVVRATADNTNDRALLRLMVVAIALLTVASGRALYSQGPEYELYANTISRTFESGDRPDSRIPYHIVQLDSRGSDPYGPLAQLLLSPWNFSDRGPIAGIMATPIVLSSVVTTAPGLPNEPWQPFDRQGFAAFRFALFAFGIATIFALFSLVLEFAGAESAWFAVALAALSPYVVHELWFTWPKMLASYFVLVGAVAIGRKRPLWGGVCLGIAYLTHPSTLFAIPCLLAFAVFVYRDVPRLALLAGLRILVPPAVAAGAWALANGSHDTQGGFLNLLMGDDNAGAGVLPWFLDRVRSTANTLIPFWLPAIDDGNPGINGIGGEVSQIGHLGFAYWCTLPFALGLFILVPMVRLAGRLVSRYPAAFWACIGIPFFIFDIYWGGASSGLLREGLHWWFFAAIAFVAVASRAPDLGVHRPGSWWLRARAVEIVLLALVPSIAASGELLGGNWKVTDVLAILMVVSGAAVLALAAVPEQTPA